MKRITKKMIVSGLVQGIGFRPFVAELAESIDLKGQVKNLGGVVEIIVSGSTQAVEEFTYRLRFASKNGELPGCRIDRLEEEILEGYKAERFSIVESGSTREMKRFLPTDLPTCDRCVGEMKDPVNRRYRYPFISCTACGPRFSIQETVPYDRESITMGDFVMCEDCRREYTKKGNIRRHAQTIACAACGPRLVYETADCMISSDAAEIVAETAVGTAAGTVTETETQGVGKRTCDTTGAEENKADFEKVLKLAAAALKEGKIGAIKDIGGFHFAFSPYAAEAAKRLREFKHRDRKPFAVMFTNLEELKEYCKVSREEEELLTSSARPIVLCEKRKDFVPEICGESDCIGALLPCNPLQILLLEETGPLVMTSGNRGGEPIVISEEEMRPYLKEGIDFLLWHDRRILTPLDDSIYQVTYGGRDGKKVYVQILRRARGLVPDPILMKRKLSADTFAAGGDLKACFALGREEMVYLSQHYGDLDEVRCQNSRKKARERMSALFALTPERTVCDLHQGYVSVREVLGEEGSVQVQHHHAHVASVIAECGLNGPVLGIACDGTGYGTDGTIWGSEFLLCEGGKMKRKASLAPVKLLGQDMASKDARVTLLCYFLEARQRGLDVNEFFEAEKSPENTIRQAAWEQGIGTHVSSSMGRFFDAAAALLGICEYNSYEGEAAILLEQAARKGQVSASQNRNLEKFHIDFSEKDGILQADGVKFLVDLYHAKETYSKEVLAYAFHQGVAEVLAAIAQKICRREGITQVVLTGGTFLNHILLGEVSRLLEEAGYQVYTNEKVPCGDGGLALGQMYLMTF